jgi:hypothetical protein
MLGCAQLFHGVGEDTMKKRAIILLISTITILVAGLSLLALMAETHPYGPDDWRYGVQNWTETVRMRLIKDPAARFEYVLSVANYCLADLAAAETPTGVDAAARALANALDVASQLTSAGVSEQRETMLAALQILFIRADLVLQALTGELATPSVVQLRNEISAALSGEIVAGEAGSATALMLQVPVPFLVATYDHTQIPISGAHAGLDCLECHLGGVYAGTQADCLACHEMPTAESRATGLAALREYPDNLNLSNLYPDHFEGECQDCHGLENWEPTAFNHAGVVECTSCHQGDVPVNPADPEQIAHYPGDCMLCHENTEDWLIASYSHMRSADCASCHDWEKPAAHYVDYVYECQVCHGHTDAWENTSHHEGYTDCAGCHEIVTPEEHYEGQCYGCHVPENWELDIHFDHTNYMEQSCLTCHEKPDVHFPGSCDTCHNTAYWVPAGTAHSTLANCNSCHMSIVPLYHYVGACEQCHRSFDSWFAVTFTHTNYSATECAGCHLKDAPRNHYCYDCCRCHDVTNWLDIYFDHVGAENCLECHTKDAPPNHYIGMCSDCHFEGTSWDNFDFDHTLYTDCLSCHIDEAPRLHYDGQCSLCHFVDSWTHIDFYHGTTYTDCVFCHAGDAPSQHYDLQCSSCHITDNWVVVDYLHNEAPFNCLECHEPPDDDHYLDNCIVCHNVTDWLEIEFEHTADYLNCGGCHVPPPGHWPGQCWYCHKSTSDWTVIVFDHSTYTDCKSCHAEDRPADHPRGQCSMCHTTTTWEIPDTPTPWPTMTPIPTRTPTPTPVFTPTDTPVPTDILPEEPTPTETVVP